MASDEDAVWTVFDEAVRGFFFEKHLPGAEADEWTDEIVAIAKEHGLRPGSDRLSVVVPVDLLQRVTSLAAGAVVSDDWAPTDAEVSDVRRLAELAGRDPDEVTPRWMLCKVTGEHDFQPLKPPDLGYWIERWSANHGPPILPIGFRGRLVAASAAKFAEASVCFRCGTRRYGDEPWPSDYDSLVHLTAIELGAFKEPSGG